jgi:hypothetical protein
MPCNEVGGGAAGAGDGEGEGKGTGAVVPWSETSCGAGRRARAAVSCVGGCSRAGQGLWF